MGSEAIFIFQGPAAWKTILAAQQLAGTEPEASATNLAALIRSILGCHCEPRRGEAISL